MKNDKKGNGSAANYIHRPTPAEMLASPQERIDACFNIDNPRDEALEDNYRVMGQPVSKGK